MSTETRRDASPVVTIKAKGADRDGERAHADARILAFFKSPESGIETLGTLDHAGSESLRLLDEISQSQQCLTELNQQLVPLMARFRPSRRASRFVRWFTGAALEEELSLPDVCAQLESLARQGLEQVVRIERRSCDLQDEARRLEADIESLEQAIRVGRQVASPRYEAWRAACPAPAEIWQRLDRRLANLEAMATSLRLTQKQYLMAARHGKTIIDRFQEIQSLLMPLWYQRMGFELFASRVGKYAAAVSTDERRHD